MIQRGKYSWCKGADMTEEQAEWAFITISIFMEARLHVGFYRHCSCWPQTSYPDGAVIHGIRAFPPGPPENQIYRPVFIRSGSCVLVVHRGILKSVCVDNVLLDLTENRMFLKGTPR